MPSDFYKDLNMYAGMASKIRGRGRVFCMPPPPAGEWIYALIRKAVGVGGNGRGPGDQASEVIELGFLGELIYDIRSLYQW